MERRTTFENKKKRFDSGRMVFSIEQIEDVLELLVNEKRPDWHFGDDECLLWELIYNKLGMDFR